MLKLHAEESLRSAVESLKDGLSYAHSEGLDVESIEVIGAYSTGDLKFHARVSPCYSKIQNLTRETLPLKEVKIPDFCIECAISLEELFGDRVFWTYCFPDIYTRIQEIKTECLQMEDSEASRESFWRLLQVAVTYASAPHYDFNALSKFRSQLVLKGLALHKELIEELSKGEENSAPEASGSRFRKWFKKSPPASETESLLPEWVIVDTAKILNLAPALLTFYPPIIEGCSLTRVPLNVLEFLGVGEYGYLRGEVNDGVFETLSILHKDEPEKNLKLLLETAQLV